MFRVGMVDRYALHDQYLNTQDVANYDKSITAVAHPLISLAPHMATPDKPSMIQVSLFLSSLDRENAAFIVTHAQQINEML